MKLIMYLLIIAMVVSCVNHLESSRPVAVKSLAELQADVRLDKATDMRLAIKSTLRDPDSVKWIHVLTNADGSLGCFNYRARNGFGGMVIEYTAIYNGSVVDWNKHCSKAALYEIGILEY